ncbi:MAG: glutamate synthase subunit beta [Myxococcota bacterium]|nr:glutamate synthase subunit beta [Myxococcota bacterium]
MTKVIGFKEWGRIDERRRPVEVRLQDWREVSLSLESKQAQEQGSRCMDCGVPFCHQGCPLGNLIPDWNQAVSQGDWKRAYLALSETNNFPEFTGRLCPAPCEGSCVLGINDDPVAIEGLERAIAERAFEEGWVREAHPQKESGHRVAIVGSGPAGLAAASQLRRAGHAVTVYEQRPEVGGLLRYGIPDFKLEKTVLDRRISLMREAGIQFETSVQIAATSSPADQAPGEGRRLAWTTLRAEFDAVLLCLGAEQPRDLPLPGRTLAGIHFAMEFLTEQNEQVSHREEETRSIDAWGKRVLVIGGGDTGSDCLGTALRQGARSVTQIEIFPEHPNQRAAENPWPQWPLIQRSSSSHEEGGQRRYAWMSEAFVGDEGRVTGLSGRPVRRTAEGKLEPIDAKTPAEVIEADLILLALGFLRPRGAGLKESLGLDFDQTGRIQRGKDFQTSLPGVYVAGDASRGASLIVWAISDGREAAREIDLALMGESSLPTRGEDSLFYQ